MCLLRVEIALIEHTKYEMGGKTRLSIHGVPKSYATTCSWYFCMDEERSQRNEIFEYLKRNEIHHYCGVCTIFKMRKIHTA